MEQAINMYAEGLEGISDRSLLQRERPGFKQRRAAPEICESRNGGIHRVAIGIDGNQHEAGRHRLCSPFDAPIEAVAGIVILTAKRRYDGAR